MHIFFQTRKPPNPCVLVVGLIYLSYGLNAFTSVTNASWKWGYNLIHKRSGGNPSYSSCSGPEGADGKQDS
ncbi:hypothetical protein TNIN_452831 [Trichonephila inaurata madagascariensis]|uniref:Uncharacterized protein n=1 Tax=Trichonephila inaurata madagascariensis TaxID=2747483 RepID=A0A8X6YT60_9ARAC|nr:hypothetical protein TNIN_452831 [Trichonephila inaurata madagascariensis]